MGARLPRHPFPHQVLPKQVLQASPEHYRDEYRGHCFGSGQEVAQVELESHEASDQHRQESNVKQKPEDHRMESAWAPPRYSAKPSDASQTLHVMAEK